MSINREISFSAKDNGVESTMSRIKRSAKELSSDLMREAQASTTGQKDMLKNYEDQIRAIERRNKIDAEGQKMIAREALDRSNNSASATHQSRKDAQAEYKKTMGQISGDSKADLMQVRLLREIADTVKLDSRKVAEADVKDNDDQSALKRFFGGGGKGKGGGTSGGGGSIDREQNAGTMRHMDVAGYLQGAQAALSSTTGSQALTGVGGAMMGMGGKAAKVGKLMSYVGMAGEVMNLQSNTTADIRKPMMGLTGMTGYTGQQIDEKGIGDSAYKFGYTRSEYLSNILPGVATARGTSDPTSILNASKGVMSAQRGTGLDMSTVMSLEKMGGRGMLGAGGGGNAMDVITRVIQAGEGSGMFRGKDGKLDLSRLQESMDSFVSMQNNSMMSSGNITSMEGALQTSALFDKIGGIYNNQEYKTTAMESMNRGIGSQSSPESKAYKMSILRKAMPDASYSELQEEMDKGGESEFLKKGIFDMVGQRGGSKNEQAIMLHELMGGQMKWADVNRIVEEGSMLTGDYQTTGKTGANPWTADEIENRGKTAADQSVQDQIKREQDWQDAKSNPMAFGEEFIGGVSTAFSEALSAFGDKYF